MNMKHWYKYKSNANQNAYSGGHIGQYVQANGQL